MKTRKVNFLYKFAPGVTLSSFGIAVAEMAGIGHDVIQKAEKRSSEFNYNIKCIKSKIDRIKLEN
jgi:DNA mismatch repair ATPase MutS